MVFPDSTFFVSIVKVTDEPSLTEDADGVTVYTGTAEGGDKSFTVIGSILRLKYLSRKYPPLEH